MDEEDSPPCTCHIAPPDTTAEAQSGISGSNSSGVPSQSKPVELNKDLPCPCWHRDGRDGLKGPKPVAPHLVNSAISSQLLGAVDQLNNLIDTARSENARLLTSQPLPDPKFRQTVASCKTAILMAIDVAMITVRTTPGYVCRVGSKSHDQCLAQREAALQHIENELKRGADDAAPLFAAREKLLRIEADMRRRKYLQTAIRAMSIIAVPYAPLASALFAAVDLFGVSTVLAIKEFYMSDILSLLRDTVERVQDLEANLQDKLAQVKELRDHLEALKARLEQLQREPIATRLSDVLDTLCAVKTAVEGALSWPCDGCDSSFSPVPMREVVKAYKDMAEALEAPSMISGSLADLSDEQCEAVDGLLSLCRTAVDPTPEPLSPSPSSSD